MAIDYNALAQQTGALASTPPPGGVDYDALARKTGAIASTPAPDPMTGGQPVPNALQRSYSANQASGNQVVAGPPSDIPVDVSNPLTPISSLSPRDVANMPNAAGARSVVDGAAQIANAGSARDVAGGAHKIVTGALDQGKILLPAAAVANPVGTVVGLAAGTLASKAISSGMKAAGVPDEYSDLAGDAAGLVAGGKAGEGASNAAQYLGEAGGPFMLKDPNGGLLARASDAVGDAASSAAGAVGDSLRSSAEKNIYDALNPTTKVNKALTRNVIAPGLVERGTTAASLADLQNKAQANADSAGTQIDNLFDQYAEQGKALSPQPVLDRLEAEKQNYIVDGVAINPAYVDRLSALQTQVAQISRNNGGDIPLASLRKIRQAQDELVSQSKNGFALPPDDQSQVNASKELGNAIRSSFAGNVPDLADANKEFSFWSNVDKVAGDTILRKTGQRAPLTKSILQNAGMMLGDHIAGPLGAFAGRAAGGALADLQQSTIWNTLSAKVKGNVADLLGAGDSAGAAAAIKQWNPTAGPTADEILGPKPVEQPALGQAPEATGTPATVGRSQAVIDAANAPSQQPLGLTAGKPAVESIPADPHEVAFRNLRRGELTEGGTPSRLLQLAKPWFDSGDIENAGDLRAFDQNGRTPLKSWAEREAVSPKNAAGTGQTPAVESPSDNGQDSAGAGASGAVDAPGDGIAGGAGGARAALPGASGDEAAVAGRTGKPTVVRVAGESRGYAARYELREADEVQGSHSGLTFQPNPNFQLENQRNYGTAVNQGKILMGATPGKFDPAYLADAPDALNGAPVTDEDNNVLAGNGRKAILDRVFRSNPKGAAAYRQMLLDNADRFGLDPQAIQGMKQPVQNENGLTPEGKARVSQLMLGRFFNDPSQLDAMAVNVRGKLERAAAPLARVDGEAGWDLTPHVRDAVDLLDRARAAGSKNLDDFMDQSGLYGRDKYSPQAQTLAKALQNVRLNDLVKGARGYAADASYARGGATLLGDAPTPEQSFAEHFGSLKSGAQMDAEAALAKSKQRVNTENSRAPMVSENARPYDAPRLSGNRSETYPSNASDLDHLQHARFERIPLSAEDSQNAAAWVANLRGFEYINRMTGRPADTALAGISGHHIASDQLRALIGNLQLDEANLKGAPTPGLDQLMQAAQEARASGKSLIIVKDHVSTPDVVRATTLNEEMNHAAQRAATGPLDAHLGGSAKGFIQGPIGSLAVRSLQQTFGYRFRSAGEAAAEIGARLMQPGQYQELGLSKAEGRALASEYMQRLDKEYGHAKVSAIGRRIIDAFR